MVSRKLLGLSLCLAVLGCKGDAVVGDIKLEFELHQSVLPNGLTVLMLPDSTFPIVSYQTWFRVGSVDEQVGKTGLAHLFEHLMFKGTAAFGPRLFFEKLETQGAEVNAYTARDYTVFYQNFSPEHLPLVIEMEADRMRGLKLNKELLETERLVVFEERRLRSENSPDGRMQEALWQLAFPDHPYGNPVIGYPQDLLSIDVDALQDFYDKHYQPSNAAVIISGRFDPVATLAEIQKRYGSLGRQEPPERPAFRNWKQDSERRMLLKDDVATARFSHGYRITNAADADTPALDVLSQILFTGSNSRAYKKLVEQSEILIGVSGASFTPTYPGLFLVSGILRQGKKIAQAEAALDRVIDEIKQSGVSKEEVRVAVRQLMMQYLDNASSASGLAQLMGSVHTILGDASKLHSDLLRLNQVTPGDVQLAATKYLDPNSRNAVVLLPTSGDESKW